MPLRDPNARTYMQSVWFPSSSEFVKLLLRTARRVELTRAGLPSTSARSG